MRRSLVRTALCVVLTVAATWQPRAQPVVSDARVDSLRFAVLGDFGTGNREQYEVAEQMAAAHATFPFALVLALGDNMYGRQESQDFLTKFQRPYGSLLQSGVSFFAALGNHDKPANRDYAGYNMNGQRYYTYTRAHVRFVVLDTNQMEPRQLEWADTTLSTAREPWKIVYFHHPLYSNGRRHGSNVELRVALEPILVRHGVQVVFAGHEHVYERLKPQRGITHFVAGSGGQLRRGDVRPADNTAAYFDQDQAFMLVEIAADALRFRTISRTGGVVDSGVIPRRPTT